MPRGQSCLSSYCTCNLLRWIRGAGHIHINGTKYRLNQAHWHTPTEHTINGRRFNLELHLVHLSIDAKVVVIGILYKIGRPDSFLVTVRTISREQLCIIREAVHDEANANTRPVQALNNRWLKLYTPDDDDETN
ncbi:putative carbonic anhydrase [Helianthus anomalus]